jgi:hypothetical protein
VASTLSEKEELNRRIAWGCRLKFERPSGFPKGLWKSNGGRDVVFDLKKEIERLRDRDRQRIASGTGG